MVDYRESGCYSAARIADILSWHARLTFLV